MKRIIFLLMTIAVVFGLSSCDPVQTLSEADAKKVVEAVSSAASGSLGSAEAGRSAEDTARALTSSFQKTQTGGGIAQFTVRTNRNENVGEGLSSAAAYFNIEYTDFDVVVTDEDGDETTYTLNGTMYMEYKYTASWASGFSLGYEVLCFTDSEDELLVDGGGINTQLELNVSNTVAMNISAGNSYTISYECSGTCNGNTFSDESGTLTASITE